MIDPPPGKKSKSSLLEKNLQCNLVNGLLQTWTCQTKSGLVIFGTMILQNSSHVESNLFK